MTEALMKCTCGRQVRLELSQLSLNYVYTCECGKSYKFKYIDFAKTELPKGWVQEHETE